MTNAIQEVSWHTGLSQGEKKVLKKYADEIFVIADQTAKTVKEAKIQIGSVLNKARQCLPNDAAFGQWARANTPFDAPQQWGQLMHLSTAKDDGILTDEMVDNSSPAVLAKIIRLPEAVRDELLDKVESGEQVKREDVPTVAQAEKIEPTTTVADYMESVKAKNEEEAQKAITSSKSSDNKPAPVREEQTDWKQMIELDFADRIESCRAMHGSFDQLELSLLLLGLDNDPQNLPNTKTLEYIKSGLIEFETDSKVEEMQVKAAVQTINDARSEW